MRMSVSGKLLVVAAVAVLACWGPDTLLLLSRLDGPSFPEALLASGTLVALAIAAWTVVAAILVVAGVSSQVVRAVTPRALRRAILVGAAGALVIAPAHAEQVAGPDAVVRHPVGGLPFPDRPDAVSTTGDAPASTAPPAVAAPPVDVRPGDTLWAIARRTLPADATGADIAAATRAWHAANRAVIGDDPDLIFPAQRLVPPTAKDLP